MNLNWIWTWCTQEIYLEIDRIRASAQLVVIALPQQGVRGWGGFGYNPPCPSTVWKVNAFLLLFTYFTKNFKASPVGDMLKRSTTAFIDIGTNTYLSNYCLLNLFSKCILLSELPLNKTHSRKNNKCTSTILKIEFRVLVGKKFIANLTLN